MSNFHITLEQLRESGACKRGYNQLVAYLDKLEEPDLTSVRSYVSSVFSDTEEIPLSNILKSNGLLDAVWCVEFLEGGCKEKLGQVLSKYVWRYLGEEPYYRSKYSAFSFGMVEKFLDVVPRDYKLANPFDRDKEAWTDFVVRLEAHVFDETEKLANFMLGFMSEVDVGNCEEDWRETFNIYDVY